MQNYQQTDMQQNYCQSEQNYDQTQQTPAQVQQYQVTEDQLQQDNVHQQNNQTKQKHFTDFENLPNYTPGTDLNQVATQALNYFQGNDWQLQFDAIDNLRIFNKYYYENINNIIEQYARFILDLVDKSKKSQVTKNCILFIQEVFAMQSQKPNVSLNIQFIEQFVPILLKFSTSGHQNIKNVAQSAINTFCDNCYSQEVSLVAACKGCFKSQIQSAQQISLKVLDSIVKKLDQNFMKISEQNLQVIMKTLAAMLEQLKPVHSEAIVVCQTIGGIIGQENYINLMQVTLSVNEHQNMQKHIMEDFQKRTKKQQSTQRQSLATYLKNGGKNNKFAESDTQIVMNQKQQQIAQTLENQRQFQQQQNIQFGGSYNQNMQNQQQNQIFSTSNSVGNQQQINNNNNNNGMGFNSYSNGF